MIGLVSDFNVNTAFQLGKVTGVRLRLSSGSGQASVSVQINSLNAGGGYSGTLANIQVTVTQTVPGYWIIPTIDVSANNVQLSAGSKYQLVSVCVSSLSLSLSLFIM